jgi:glycosyltransferase involved in cell wall biosynthesis
MVTSSKTPRILFVNNEPEDQMTPFIKKDLLLLREWYPVEYLAITQYRGLFDSPILSPRVWNAVMRNDVVFEWFGQHISIIIMARILGKPSIIVGGGGDVVSIPEIGYGLNKKIKWQYYLKTLGFRLADRVLLFSESSLHDFLSLPGIEPQKAEILYLSVDVDFFKPDGRKKNHALTVAYLSESSIVRKGILTFIETARLTPEINFRLVGKIVDSKAAEKIRSILPSNVEFFGDTDNDKILREHIPGEYQEAKAYVQLSHHEGFGVAMAEAMACGCVPVVTNRGAIPEVVGDTGFYVPVDDPHAASEVIRKIMSSDDEKQGERARERIVKLYSTSKRAQGLKAAIEKITTK